MIFLFCGLYERNKTLHSYAFPNSLLKGKQLEITGRAKLAWKGLAIFETLS
jgi:hypothetical protein